MFAPKVAKAHTKAAERATRKLAPQRSVLAARAFGSGAIEQAHMLQQGIGNQAMLRSLGQQGFSQTGKESAATMSQEPAPENMAAREAQRGVSWDFSKIPLYPSDWASRPQAPFPFAQRNTDAQRWAKDGADSDHSAGCGCAVCSGAGHNSLKDSNRDAAGGPSPPISGGPSGVKRTVSIYAVSLPGSSRSPDPDIAKANAVWAQCSLAVSLAGGQSWQTDVLDKLPPNGVLNEYPSPESPTGEESSMLAHQPGGASAIHAYYVPSMSSGSRGESFIPSITPTLPPAVVVSDSAASDTFAHELGHVLLNDLSHHADPNNLMATGAIRNIGTDKLDGTQCGKV